jgi:Holliday junction resolvase RusA-like endonuclease
MRMREPEVDALPWIRKATFNEGAVQGWIPGPLPTKSNQRKFWKFGKRLVSVKSDKAQAWLAQFIHAARPLVHSRGWEPLAGRLYLTAIVTPENMRRDLDVELLCDALQHSGLIKNDRDLWNKSAVRNEPQKDGSGVFFEVGRIALDSAKGGE